MTWDVRGVDASWCQENYTVYVGTEPTPSNLTASSISYNETILAFGPMADACGVSWASRSLDISAASGTEAYIGFRHHAVSDMFQLHIDDLAVTSESLSTGDLLIENLNYHYENDLDKLFINSDEILYLPFEVYNSADPTVTFASCATPSLITLVLTKDIVLLFLRF